MSYWSTSQTKTMRKVGDIWLDPANVDAAEEIEIHAARFHLHNGASVTTQIPQGKNLDWMMGQLFKENK